MGLWEKAKSYASGFLKPIDEHLGTDFAHIDDRNAQIEEANTARQFSASEADKERQWQTEMSNTAHQREVADLQKAGLNPVLSAGGTGASSSAGASATPTMAQISPTTARKMHQKEIELADKTIDNIEKQNEKLDAETKQIKQDTEINTPDAETAKALAWWNSTWAGKFINVAGNVVKTISPFTDAVNQTRNANTARQNTNYKQKPKQETTTHYNNKGKATGTTIKTKH